MLANVDISALAIPDFVAGFVYGLTGDNNLTEIEACYQGGEVMAAEIEAGIADIKIGGTDHDIQAGLQFALAATQIPIALKTCEGMGDDISAIEQWASIFKDPAKLAQKLALHYARHKGEIQTDISTLESDWDSQKYFDAGKDLADIATLAIGPIKSTVGDAFDCGLNDTIASDIVAGFMYEMPGSSKTITPEYMESCFKPDDNLLNDICSAANDFATKDNQRVLAGIQKVLADLPTINASIAACPNAQADWDLVGNWFKYWKGQGEMRVYQTAYKNFSQNYQEIAADAGKVSDAFTSQNFYDTGRDANILALKVLPAPPTMEVEEGFDCGLNDAMVADLMAGFMVQMPGSSGVDRHEYMESCFNTTAYPQFLDDMCSAANSFATKDNQQVLAGIQKVLADLPQLKTIMTACPDAAADWGLVSGWFKYWKGQGEMKVYQEAYKNFSQNYQAIADDANKVSDAFVAKDFYGAGKEANAVGLAVLPAPPTLGESNNTCGLNQTMIADILAGFVDGFTGHDDRADLESCLAVTDAFEQDMCDVAEAFATKDNQRILAAIQTILGDLSTINTMLAGCPNDQADFVPAENWFKFWKGQGEMKVYSTAYKNLSQNYQLIAGQASQISDAYEAGDYFTVGKVAAEIGTEALPQQQALGEANNTCGLTTPIIADILAGFVMGFTGKDDRVDLEACFKDTDAFEQDMCDVAEAFATKDNQRILAGIQTIMGDLSTINTMLAGCPNDQADFQPAENWFKFWKGQGEMKVYQEAYKNVANNFAQISSQASELSDAYTSGDFFSVGKDAATIAVEVLPQQAAEFLQ